MSVELIHGDCLEVMPTLPAQSVQMVFADLPFGVTAQQWDIPLCLNKFWKNLERLAANERAPTIATATQPYATDLIISRRKEFRYDLVWDKVNPVGFLNVNRMPLRSHELILVFSKKSCTYYPQKSLGLPWKNSSRAKNGDPNYGKVRVNNKPTVNNGMRHAKSILVFPKRRSNANQALHPTRKPEALLEWLIKTYSNHGDTILDPVAGSGTTAIAAMRTGRKAICIEKDPTYFAVMQKRVAEERARLDALPN